MECKTCGKTDAETSLEKCSICHKGFCEDHGFALSGRKFCSRFCGEYFFFAEEDD